MKYLKFILVRGFKLVVHHFYYDINDQWYQNKYTFIIYIPSNQSIFIYLHVLFVPLSLPPPWPF